MNFDSRYDIYVRMFFKCITIEDKDYHRRLILAIHQDVIMKLWMENDHIKHDN